MFDLLPGSLLLCVQVMIPPRERHRERVRALNPTEGENESPERERVRALNPGERERERESPTP